MGAGSVDLRKALGKQMIQWVQRANVWPFNEICVIMHEQAGTPPAQFTCSACHSSQLYQRSTSKYKGKLSQLNV